MSEEIKIFRFSEKTKEWRTLRVDKTEGGAFISMQKGIKGSQLESEKISMKLDEKEIAWLAMKLQKMV
jgi:hypothetical protein